MDVVVANNGPKQVWENEFGIFSAGQSFGGGNSNAIVSGDWNGDGWCDLVIGNQANFNTVWFGSANGFSNPTGQQLGNQTTNGLAVGDLDGDGDQDLFAANTGANKVYLNIANLAPIANPDEVTTPEDTPVTISPLANDTDPDGLGTLALTKVGAAQNGLATQDGQTVVYSPTLNFNGTDTFTYTVSDGLFEAEGTVEITVTAVNDAPVITLDCPNQVQVESLMTCSGDVVDVDRDVITVTLLSVTGPITGWINPPVMDGSQFVITGTAPISATGVHTLTVAADDGIEVSSADATVNVVEVLDENMLFLPLIIK
jgi:VCBS repeat-containing protein